MRIRAQENQGLADSNKLETMTVAHATFDEGRSANQTIADDV